MSDRAGSSDAVVIERVFDAPVAVMWQMWTDPEHFKAWFGPTGASIPVAKMDVRVGGLRHICMEMATPNGPMQMWFTGEYLDVAGRQLPLSPRHLASAGILYTPQYGVQSTLVVTYVGRRFLDEENIAPVGGYTRIDATLGYRTGPFQVTLEGTNLTDQRPPVSASEFGSESFYLLNARALWVRFTYRRS